jgi:hypothetical protein
LNGKEKGGCRLKRAGNRLGFSASAGLGDFSCYCFFYDIFPVLWQGSIHTGRVQIPWSVF